MAIDTAGESRATAETFEVINPADGSVIANVPVDGPAEVAATVARVRANQPAWEALGIKGRARWLGKLRDWLLDHQDEIADTMQRETGKVRAEAMGETPYITDLINFYGKKARRYIGDERVPAHSPLMKVKKLKVQYRPYPVVGVISPWNFPLILSLGDAIPALIAGCAVVIKPSEITPLGPGEIVEAWKREIGGPDVFDVVNGMGETGSALVDEVDFVQFTGSDRTAKKVLARAAETLTPVSAELGGKDPMIVLRTRQPRQGRQRSHLGRVRQLRADLHLGRTHLRRGADLRRVPHALRRRGREAEPGHGRPGARQGRGRDDLPRSDRHRRVPRRGRPRERCDRSSRAVSAATVQATGTSRP